MLGTETNYKNVSSLRQSLPNSQGFMFDDDSFINLSLLLKTLLFNVRKLTEKGLILWVFPLDTIKFHHTLYSLGTHTWSSQLNIAGFCFEKQSVSIGCKPPACEFKSHRKSLFLEASFGWNSTNVKVSGAHRAHHGEQKQERAGKASIEEERSQLKSAVPPGCLSTEWCLLPSPEKAYL